MEQTNQNTTTCPLTKGSCTGEDCALWIKYEDWQGCVFHAGDILLREAFRILAKNADRLFGLKKGPRP